jgi:hypothetical protein
MSEEASDQHSAAVGFGGRWMLWLSHASRTREHGSRGLFSSAIKQPPFLSGGRRLPRPSSTTSSRTLPRPVGGIAVGLQAVLTSLLVHGTEYCEPPSGPYSSSILPVPHRAPYRASTPSVTHDERRLGIQLKRLSPIQPTTQSHAHA